MENFRAFKDQTIFLDDYTCLVGQGGSAKSTVITALNIFFRETSHANTDLVNLSAEDFHNHDTTKAIRITVTFVDLSHEAQKDLKDYFRQGELVISAVAEWNGSKLAEVKQFGQRLGMEQFRVYFEGKKVGKTAEELKKIFAELKTKFPELRTEKTKDGMEEALHDFEAAHPAECMPIPSEDQFYGVSRGENRIQKYLQWVYVPALKDASAEQIEARDTALGKLLERRVHASLSLSEPLSKIKKEADQKYDELLQANTAALTAVSKSLSKRLKQWSHKGTSVDLNWNKDEKSIQVSKPSAAVRATEGLFRGELARFGHGLQRSFIIALLQELADHDVATGPRLVLAVEEPELFQHPPQARYLATVLQKLSTQNSQVLVCTHSPYFVSGKGFENLRMFLKDPKDGSCSIKQANFDALSKRIAAATGQPPMKPGGLIAKVEQEMLGPMNEMFFAAVRVFLEGVEDLAYLNTYLSLTGKIDEFREHGCSIVQVEGKSHLIQAIAVSLELQLPLFTVYDSDSDAPEQNGQKKKHEQDNTAILRLHGIEDPKPFPDKTFHGDNFVAWSTKIGDIIKAEFGAENWKKLEEQVRAKHKNFAPGMEKNSLFIAYIMTEAWEQGLKSQSLIDLCDRILTYARSLTKAESIEAEVVAEKATELESLPSLASDDLGSGSQLIQ